MRYVFKSKVTERRESYDNQDRSVGQAADRKEKGCAYIRKMKRGVGTQWENERRRIERDGETEGRGEREREGKREKNPRASSTSGLLGTADSLRGYFKV